MNDRRFEFAPFLEVRGVTKQFGSFTALSDIELDIREGELVTFLGPSGCGKSTLLRIIAGLERQTKGLLLQSGADISRQPAGKRGFGILFQSYALFPNLTVAQNVGYGIEGKGAQVKARVRELLALVGLPDIENKYPSELSGGQQQRVALARALAPSPSLLLLDEPLSALDAKVRVHLRQQIRELQRTLGITTIMVTHDQEEALAIADRIVVMNHGTVEQVGTPAEIYGHPKSLFVADFVGRMNFLSGRAGPNGTFALNACDCHLELASPAPPGDNCILSIRPEDIVLSPAPGNGGVNTALATIKEMEFLGSFYRTDLVVADWGGAVLTADIPIQNARGLKLQPGERLAVTLSPAVLKTFPGTRHA
ncbi:putative 2-aminoethylphosphonate ABC transporter ATP-binding protein [Rhodoligotrophos defluvii]|uniref:putative 2-aminoethylphosphonate ABC transporter ATP-binding protein n=1 Tax=Rhodoligotrophos defluvii TaxID=2561934 RepID=UPI0010C988B9|nr:putative 2-aminoethylphosphonate ABC transporter ATP-binding protein [Rhodoligotrophos defluvii]